MLAVDLPPAAAQPRRAPQPNQLPLPCKSRSLDHRTPGFSTAPTRSVHCANGPLLEHLVQHRQSCPRSLARNGETSYQSRSSSTREPLRLHERCIRKSIQVCPAIAAYSCWSRLIIFKQTGNLLDVHRKLQATAAQAWARRQAKPPRMLPHESHM